MGITDRIAGLYDRLWLRYNGMDHDIRLDDRLREELSSSTMRRMDEATAGVDELFASTGYSPAIYEVEAMDADERAAGRYNGREETRPQIELDPEAVPLPAIWAHELGHDVADELEVYADGDTLLSATFDELFAALTAYTVMEEVDGRHIYDGTPFRSGHEDEWQRLRDCFDREQRDREAALLEDVDDAMDDGDWERLQRSASELAAVPPGITPETDELSLDGYRPSMATYHFFEDPERLKYELAQLADARQRAELLPDSDAADIVYEAYADRDDGLQQRLTERVEEALCEDPFGRHAVEMRQEHGAVSPTVESLEQDRLEEVYDTVLEDELEETVERLAGELEGVETDPDPAALLEELGEERYGYDTEIDGEAYRDAIDLPHTVGAGLARQLYRDGDDPLDIVEEPEQYEALCEDALTYTLDHGLGGGSIHSYDLSTVLAE